MAHAHPASPRAMSRPAGEEPPVTIATARRETVGDTSTRSSDANPGAPVVARAGTRDQTRDAAPGLRGRNVDGRGPPLWRDIVSYTVTKHAAVGFTDVSLLVGDDVRQ